MSFAEKIRKEFKLAQKKVELLKQAEELLRIQYPTILPDDNILLVAYMAVSYAASKKAVVESFVKIVEDINFFLFLESATHKTYFGIKDGYCFIYVEDENKEGEVVNVSSFIDYC